MAIDVVAQPPSSRSKTPRPDLIPHAEPISITSPPGLASILIPCCGQLEYTKLCVPSLLAHTRPPFELIFLDIGSLDGRTKVSGTFSMINVSTASTNGNGGMATATGGGVNYTSLSDHTVSFAAHQSVATVSVSLTTTTTLTGGEEYFYLSLSEVSGDTTDTINSNLKTATLYLLGSQKQPAAAVQTYTVDENQVLQGGAGASLPGLLAGDSDFDGDTLSLISINSTAVVPGTAIPILQDSTTIGSLLVDNAGDFQYTPATGFIGTANFTYTAAVGSNEMVAEVSINVQPAGPVLTLPGPLNVTPGTTVPITGVSVTDPNAGSPGLLQVTLQVSQGTLELPSGYSYPSGFVHLGSGTSQVTLQGTPSDVEALLTYTNGVQYGLEYESEEEYTGTDTLTGTAEDMNNTLMSNGEPLGSSPSADGTPITVAPSSGPLSEVTVDAPTNTTVGLNIAWPIYGVGIEDTGIDTSDLHVIFSVSHGTLTFNTGVAGGVTSGEVSNNSSGTVTVSASLAAVNTTLAGDIGLEYQGTTAYVGPDTLHISAEDETSTDQGEADEQLTVDNPPVAKDDSGYTVAAGGTLTETTSVLANDIPSSGLTALLITPPEEGTVTLKSDGTFVYKASAGYEGPDTFTYMASDGLLLSQPATVTIEVTDSSPEGLCVPPQQEGCCYDWDGCEGCVSNASQQSGDVTCGDSCLCRCTNLANQEEDPPPAYNGPNLIAKPVPYANKPLTGVVGAYIYPIQWQLTNNSPKGGWIIQKIDMEYTFWDGNQDVTTAATKAINNALQLEDKAQFPTDGHEVYWEAWKVDATAKLPIKTIGADPAWSTRLKTTMNKWAKEPKALATQVEDAGGTDAQVKAATQAAKALEDAAAKIKTWNDVSDVWQDDRMVQGLLKTTGKGGYTNAQCVVNAQAFYVNDPTTKVDEMMPAGGVASANGLNSLQIVGFGVPPGIVPQAVTKMQNWITTEQVDGNVSNSVNHIGVSPWGSTQLLTKANVVNVTALAQANIPILP